ncbi:hypothetical protein [Cyclobacterium roseum]|uniref:hypothetical protein n=1 Tax=Cyclobacterium roseum TaxID=2666137 RepID=UPI001391CB6E|nr:hypothetical protein [Cyclobacterium roseum]
MLNPRLFDKQRFLWRTKWAKVIFEGAQAHHTIELVVLDVKISVDNIHFTNIFWIEGGKIVTFKDRHSNCQ